MGKKTKADVLREAAREQSGLEWGEYWEYVQSALPELKASYNEAYKYFHEVRAAAPAPPPEPAASQPVPPKVGPSQSLSELLAFFRKAVEAVGGRDEARKLLDLLG